MDIIVLYKISTKDHDISDAYYVWLLIVLRNKQ